MKRLGQDRQEQELIHRRPSQTQQSAGNPRLPSFWILYIYIDDVQRVLRTGTLQLQRNSKGVLPSLVVGVSIPGTGHKVDNSIYIYIQLLLACFCFPSSTALVAQLGSQRPRQSRRRSVNGLSRPHIR